MGKLLLSRIALPVACLLVFIPAGHAALPMGLGFFRFLNPQYSIEPLDWLILSTLAIGIGLSVASYWHARRLLGGCSIIAFVSMIALVYHAWAEFVDPRLLITAIPFVAVSIWTLFQSGSLTPNSA